MIGGLTLAEMWLIAGALLIVAEMIAPGFFLIWIGAAAIFTGAMTWAQGLPTEAAFVLFAITVVVLIFAAKSWLPYKAGVNPSPLLNQRAKALIGRTVTVEEAISSTGGRVTVGDGAWSAKGCDAAVGARVTIIAAEGNVLIVEKA